MNVGSLQIDIIANLAKLSSDMDKVQKSVDSTMRNVDKSVGIAKNAFASLTGAIGAGAIIKLADEYKRFDSQLKLATKSTKEYEQAYKRVIDIARTSQSDIGAIGVLYARLTNNLREFGTTQKDIGTITESVALSLRVSNATVQETNSVMLQLSQSFGSGRINGQEFLAVSEGAPIIMRQLAKSLNVTYGELKELSAQGKLTAETLKTALTDPAYLASLQEQVKAVGTISSAMTVFMNNLKVFIGEADKANGAGKALANTIIFLGDNLATIANIALAALLVQTGKYIQSMYAGIAASRAKQAELIKEQIIIERKAAVEAAAAFASANNARMQTFQATRNSAAILENAAVQRELASRVGVTATAVRGLSSVVSTFGGVLGIAATALILFGDKLYDMGKRALGITPAVERLNELMERNADLRAKGLDPSDPLASQKSQLQEDIALVAQLSKSSERFYAISKGVTQATREELQTLQGLSVGQLSSSEIKKRAGAIASQYAQRVVQSNAAIKDSQVKLDVDMDASNRKQKLADAETLKDLKTKAQITKEYQEQVAKVIEAQSRSNLSDAEKQEQLALLKAAYDKAIGGIDKKTGATKLETEAEKLAKIADEERQKSILDLVEAQKDLIDANNKARQSVIDASLSQNEATQKEIESTQEAISLLQMGENAHNELQEAKLRDAIATAELTVANAKLNGATLDAINYAQEYVDTLKARLELQDQLTDVKMQEKAFKAEKEAIKDAEKARIDSMKEIAKEQERQSDALTRSLTDALFRGFENGKSFAKSFKDGLINSFKTLILQPLIKFLVDGSGLSKILGSIGTIFSGGASAGGIAGAGGGGFGGILESGKDIFNVITKGFEGANIAFEQGIQSFGTFLTEGFGGIGKSLGGLISQYSGAIYSALPFAGAALKLLQGDIKGAASQGIGGGIGFALGGPVGAGIGAALGSLVGGLFGGSKLPPRMTASRTGQFNGNNFLAQAGTLNAKGKPIGGLGTNLDAVNQAFSQSLSSLLKTFGMDSNVATRGTISKKLSTEAGFQASFAGGSVSQYQKFGKKVGIEQVFEQYASDVLGKTLVQAIRNSNLTAGIKGLFDNLVDKTEIANLINATINLQSNIKGLNQNLGLSADLAAQIARVSTGTDNTALTAYINNLAKIGFSYQTQGELLVQARQSIQSTVGQVPNTLKAFDAVFKSMVQAGNGVGKLAEVLNKRDLFAQMTAQIDGLKGNVRGALFSMVSDAEKQAMRNADLAKLFGELGREVPASVEELIALGKSIDYTTKEGLDLAAVFPSLVEAFNQTKNSVDSLMDSLREGSMFASSFEFNRYKGIAQNYGTGFANDYVDSLPSYDVGTPYVPNDGLAMLHRGEAVIPAKENAMMQASTSTFDDGIRAELRSIAISVMKSERSLDRLQKDGFIVRDVDANGDPQILTVTVV